MKVKECTGDCCRSFPLMGMRLLEFHKFSEKIESLTGTRINYPDSDPFKVLSMIRPNGGFAKEWGAPTYSCMHWDTSTKRCSNYTHRPKMCIDFPYDGRCPICQGGTV